MPAPDRRTLLKLMSAGAAATAMTDSIRRALALPANNRTGTIMDVEHIVILMQENRSFDHYLGTLRGVRGYNDPRAVVLPSGKNVFHQPDGKGGEVLPFHPDAPDLGLVFIEDLAHDWTSTHDAWNGGSYDGWVPAKTSTTMAHMKRADIPFHYALADAFTVCDAYHASLLGATDPNRYHMWTGWVGNDGKAGGPVVDNAEAGYDWSTFPEVLEAAGVSWKIYQDVGAGLTAAQYWGWGEDAYIGNYGDNSLLYFHQYQNAAPGTPLADRAKTGTNISVSGTLFDQFRADVAAGTLPQVSWIVAPEAYTEHPNWPANYGAWYVSEMLDALTANPDVWSKTVFILNYDENDGFFDHVVPPTPPATTGAGISTVDIVNEIFAGSAEYPVGPYGLGARVPCILISPWSRGGYVNSQVFDHTSVIRFIQARFGAQYGGLAEPNITPWRHAVAGDLTSAFDFKTPNSRVVTLPSTAAYVPPDTERHPDYVPTVPATQAVPSQEPGIRPARALPYQPHAFGSANAGSGTFSITLENFGAQTTAFHVRSAKGDAPRAYTIGSGLTVSDAWPVAADGSYALDVHGPNGFFRRFRGSSTGANLEVGAVPDAAALAITAAVTNKSTSSVVVRLHNVLVGETLTQALEPGQTVTRTIPLAEVFGWYDLVLTVEGDDTFRQVFAGHVENGAESISDPGMAGLLPTS